ETFFSIPITAKAVGIGISASAFAGAINMNAQYPTSPAPVAGDGMLLIVGTKLQGCRPTTPSGWRRIGDYIAWNGANGTDTGAVRLNVYFREAVGGESGAVPISLLNANSDVMMARIFTF